MQLKDLVIKTRSYRRFDESQPVTEATLRDLVDLARQTASGSNKQPLRYILVAEAERNARLFPMLGWAGYLRDWPGPAEGERPTAYIIVVNDSEIAKDPKTDLGIAAQTIMLGAAERGIGGCMIATVDHSALRAELTIPQRYNIQLVLALGVPGETVVLEPLGPAGSIEYYRDEDGVHHVPKRSLDDVILP